MAWVLLQLQNYLTGWHRNSFITSLIISREERTLKCLAVQLRVQKKSASIAALDSQNVDEKTSIYSHTLKYLQMWLGKREETHHLGRTSGAIASRLHFERERWGWGTKYRYDCLAVDCPCSIIYSARSVCYVLTTTLNSFSLTHGKGMNRTTIYPYSSPEALNVTIIKNFCQSVVTQFKIMNHGCYKVVWQGKLHYWLILENTVLLMNDFHAFLQVCIDAVHCKAVSVLCAWIRTVVHLFSN